MAQNNEESFQGLMKSLNLDESQFPRYENDFQAQDFLRLSSTKRAIESQLDQLFGLLKNQYHADMDTPLVRDGFPRADIDVVSIRLIRVKIIRLRNDHKQVLQELETKMVAEFEKRRHENPQDQNLSQHIPNEATSANKRVTGSKREAHLNIPFASVSEVVEGGPAHRAGLQTADKIVLFDTDVDATNHGKLSALAGRVKSKVDSVIEVVVVRGSEVVDLTLVPTNDWDGQGLLGCRLVPI